MKPADTARLLREAEEVIRIFLAEISLTDPDRRRVLRFLAEMKAASTPTTKPPMLRLAPRK